MYLESAFEETEMVASVARFDQAGCEAALAALNAGWSRKSSWLDIQAIPLPFRAATNSLASVPKKSRSRQCLVRWRGWMLIRYRYCESRCDIKYAHYDSARVVHVVVV